MTTKGRVVYLYRRDPQQALGRLNRLTGLRFSRWPESLVPLPEVEEHPRQDDALSPAAMGNISAR
ncbi:hypothetical protein AB5S05_02650 [Pseudomonas sp. 25A3E]|uniref:YcgL domain-containing protein n=1 Tax=Pseudomonas zhanjiangensis TaxID=3239015 RepID=A0ABV3YP19_9PSED